MKGCLSAATLPGAAGSFAAVPAFGRSDPLHVRIADPRPQAWWRPVAARRGRLGIMPQVKDQVRLAPRAAFGPGPTGEQRRDQGLNSLKNL